MNAQDVRTVLVVGTGTMGTEIGLQCALFGLEVVAHDADPQALERYPDRVRALADRHVAMGLLKPEQRDAALGRIRVEGDLEAAASDVDLVSESITEDPDAKRALWGRLGPACPKRAVLTTNTSTLLPSMFAEATGHPERFLAWHFHIPALVANVVDVMGHEGTDPAYVDTLMEVSRRIGQIPIRLKREYPGYVFNTMLVAFLRAAQRLVIDDAATPEDVDRAWMGVMRTDRGPFGIMDLVGLDTVLHVTRSSLKLNPDDQLAQRIVAWLEPKVEAGELGMKVGRGIYTYPEPAFGEPGFLTGKR